MEELIFRLFFHRGRAGRDLEKFIPIHRRIGLRLFYLSGEREIPGYNCQIATDKAITGNRYHDTPVRS